MDSSFCVSWIIIMDKIIDKIMDKTMDEIIDIIFDSNLPLPLFRFYFYLRLADTSCRKSQTASSTSSSLLS